MHYTFLRGVRLEKKRLEKKSKKMVISVISGFSVKLISWWSASACMHSGIRKGCSNYTVVIAEIFSFCLQVLHTDCHRPVTPADLIKNIHWYLQTS